MAPMTTEKSPRQPPRKKCIVATVSGSSLMSAVDFCAGTVAGLSVAVEGNLERAVVRCFAMGVVFPRIAGDVPEGEGKGAGGLTLVMRDSASRELESGRESGAILAAIPSKPALTT